MNKYFNISNSSSVEDCGDSRRERYIKALVNKGWGLRQKLAEKYVDLILDFDYTEKIRQKAETDFLNSDDPANQGVHSIKISPSALIETYNRVLFDILGNPDEPISLYQREKDLLLDSLDITEFLKFRSNLKHTLSDEELYSFFYKEVKENQSQYNRFKSN